MFKKEKSLSFRSIDELRSYLKSEGLPVDEWGQDEAKTVGHLFNELAGNECILVRTPEGLVRKVVTVNVRVYYNSPDGKRLYLKEIEQIFTDGRKRSRSWFTWSISEKLNPGETPQNAVARAFKEELKISTSVKTRSAEVEINRLTSPSFPGLSSEYVSNFFNAELNDAQFDPSGYVEVQPDKRTIWRWVEA